MLFRSDRQRLAQENADLQQRLSAANARLDNLSSERQQLQSRYTNLLKNQQSVLPDSATQKFKDLAQKYPGLEFDPETGVSRLKTDLLFDSGSTHVKESAKPLINEMAKILNTGEAKHLKILVVGHTDDQLIVRPETALKHPTNWHLSTDRADAVILELMRLGVQPERVAAMGYSEFHPLERSTADTARQRNRRVELFVVPVDQNSAKWDPVSTTSL